MITVSYSDYLTPNVNDLEVSATPLTAAGSLKTPKTAVTGILDAVIPSIDQATVDDVIAELYANVPKFVSCAASTNDVATLNLSYNNL